MRHSMLTRFSQVSFRKRKNNYRSDLPYFQGES